MRSIGAVLVGLLTGVVLIFGIEAIDAKIYPMPSGLDPQDTEAMSKALASMPFAAFAIVLAGWCIGTLAATMLASVIARNAVAPLIVGVLLVIGAALTMVQIRHPLWFMIAAAFVLVASIACGVRVAPRRAEG